MRRNPNKLTNAAAALLLGAAGVYGFVRWLLPWSAPFVLAFAAAALLEPAVATLARRGVPRPLAAGGCLLLFLGVLGALAYLLLRRLALELGELSANLPALSQSLSAAMERWDAALQRAAAHTPAVLAGAMERAIGGAEESILRLPGTLSQRALAALPSLVSAAPRALLFAVTAVIGAYFLSAGYPEVLHALARRLPDRFLYRARLLRRTLRRTLGRWLRAQGILLTITFALLTAAFALLRVEYALLLALLTALIDALPVLGTGTVLIPWALWKLLAGDTPLAVGLLLTWAGVTVLHESIQAKLLGDQLGLHPLATLAAIWLGFRVWGVAGMLVFPVLAVCLNQALAGVTLRAPWAEEIPR